VSFGAGAVRLAKKTVKWVAWRAYAVMPKRDIAVLAGFILHDDTVMALERALRDTGVHKTVILVPRGSGAAGGAGRPPEVGPETTFVRMGSLAGYAYLAVAKYVFFTHTCLVHTFPRNVIATNVWHGMPVKRVGWMNNEGPMVPITTYSVATSPFWADVVQESLRPRKGTLVTGLPRNDHLLTRDPRLRTELGCAPEAKLIVWLPTFRGAWEEGVHTLGVPDDVLPEIDALLAKHGGVLVVKPHPMALPADPPKLDNFRFVTDGWLHERDSTLYKLLGESDALITDVSSVYVDYLITDRPVVHHFPDIREYERTRGFSISPVEDYLAGPLTHDAGEFLAALGDILEGRDAAAASRRRLTPLFFMDKDAGATARLLTAVGLGGPGTGPGPAATAAAPAPAAAPKPPPDQAAR
jgi:CDP-glycerol glycerophosphotransferase (TagB/SpsB family)